MNKSVSHVIFSLALLALAVLPCVQHARAATIVLSPPQGDTVKDSLFGTNLFTSIIPDADKHLKSSIVRVAGDGSVTLNPYMIDTAKFLGLGLFRFPGPEINEIYHWRGGVGPQGTRPQMRDRNGRPFKSYLGTIEAAEYAEKVGAELILTVNFNSGSATEAANWVEFCNAPAPVGAQAWTTTSYAGTAKAPKGYFAWLRSQFGHPQPIKARFWEIGNEIYYTANSLYLGKALEFAKAMREVDPTINVGVCADPLTYEREDGLRKRRVEFNQPTLNMMVLHYYGHPQDQPATTTLYHKELVKRDFIADRSGQGKIVIRAKGTKALEWPVIRVQINGTTKDIPILSKDMQPYTLDVAVNKGSNTLAITFVNAGSVPGVGSREIQIQGMQLAFPGGVNTEVWNTRSAEYNILFGTAHMIGRQLRVLREVYPDKMLALTEVNTGYGLNDFAYSFESVKLKSALWFAMVMNGAMRSKTEVLNQFTFTSSNAGYCLVTGDGSITPTALAMKMYAAHKGKNLLPLSVQGAPTFDAPLSKSTGYLIGAEKVPHLDAIGSYDPKTGQAVLSIVNNSDFEAITVDIEASAIGLARIVSSSVLDAQQGGLEGTNIKSKNSVAIRDGRFSANGLKNLQIGPHSLTNIVLNVKPITRSSSPTSTR